MDYARERRGVHNPSLSYFKQPRHSNLQVKISATAWYPAGVEDIYEQFLVTQDNLPHDMDLLLHAAAHQGFEAFRSIRFTCSAHSAIYPSFSLFYCTDTPGRTMQTPPALSPRITLTLSATDARSRAQHAHAQYGRQ